MMGARSWRLATLMAIGVLGVLGTFGVPACSGATKSYEYEKTFGPDGTSLTGFSFVSSVAVDQGSGMVYVLDPVADALFKFDHNGNPVNFGGSSPNISGNELTGLSVGENFGKRQVAVDSTTHTIYLPGDEGPGEQGGTVLQAYQSNGEKSLFVAGPGQGTNEIPGFSGLLGIAVDLEGNIYTSEAGETGIPGYNPEGFAIFRRSGAVVVTNPTPGKSQIGPRGLAVDRHGVVYLLQNFSLVSRFVPSAYPVTSATSYSEEPPHLDPNAATAVAVEPGLNRLLVTEDFFAGGGSEVARVAVYDEDGGFEQNFGGPGAGELSRPVGIAAGPDGERVFVAQNPAGGPSQIKIFKEELCICAPEVESESVSGVTGDSATLRAKINPNNLETTYWWEYGPGDCDIIACAKVPIDGATIAGGRKGIVVTQALSGLSPHTLYHYRVVAENAEGPAIIGVSQKIFTTQGSGLGFSLSDSRAWEMVSPPKKFGGTLISSADTAIQASASGDGLVYASLGSIVGELDSNRLPEPSTVLAERSGSGQWASRDLTPTHSVATKLRSDTEFNVFTPDLGRAEMEPTDPTPLSPQSSEQTPYLWEDGAPPLFTPLLTSGNVPSGTEFGPDPGRRNNPVQMEGATTDLESIILRSENAALVEGTALKAIYRWKGGQLEAVSELPESEGGAVVEGILGSGQGSVRHAISSDGSRVFWAPGEAYGAAGVGLPALYLRDVVAGKSVRLDKKRSGGSGLGPRVPAFNGASADGRVVFFTDSQQLTAGASLKGRDLYRCEIGPVEGALGCVNLSDVSAPLAGSGESAEVLDQVPGLSEDGRRLYFVAEGVLDNTPNDEDQTAEPGSPNLYLWEEGQGTSYIATLSASDFPVWGGAPTQKLGYSDRISATVSPNGRYFAFTSEKPLTGYENRNDSGALNTEAYVYDAEAEGGRLSCVSCNPTAGAALGELRPESAGFFPPDPKGLWTKRWVAATLPEATETEPEGRSLYRPRSVLDNGRVFFNSVDPLVPADSNGNWDVYQYQPVGVGSCEEDTSAASTVRSGPGCVGLISSGAAEGDAGFMDATPSGNDVFFLTKGRLSVTDKDNELDAYDARVNGIPAVLEPIQECAGEACQPSVGAPNDPTPGSESFHGAETQLQCPKGKRSVRRGGKELCIAKKKHHKHKRHHKKKAGKSGRAGR